MPEPLVKISRASAFIPGDRERRLVLRNIDWEILSGEHAAILGPNGAGKSSLLRLLRGELRPCTGSVAWRQNGRWDESAIAGREITALVSPQVQAFCQLCAWNVTGAEILAGAESGAPLAYANAPDADAARQGGEIMAELQAPELLAMRLPELSQGQLRLLLLARALLAKPGLLLLDEWADGLDGQKRKLMAALLEKRAASATMIFTSHREEGIPDWAGRRLYLREGVLLKKAPPAGRSGNAAPGFFHKCETAGNAVLLKLENVSVYIDRAPVLRNISWTLRQGEHWSIAGPNGSGKSTLLRLLAGDEFAAAGGRMTLWSERLGREVRTMEERRRIVSLVSDLSQALYGYPLSARELVMSGCDNSVGIYREFTGEEQRRAGKLLKLFFEDAESIADSSIRRLSSGQLRRLFLARSLMAAPEILLLDEPCGGLDEEGRAAYLTLLARAAAREIPGIAPQIVLVSHYAEDVPDFVSHRARMENGALSIESHWDAVAG